MTNFEIALKNYTKGLWTDSMLEKLVDKGKITVDEYKDVVGSVPVNADLHSVKSAAVARSKELLNAYLLENPLVWLDGNSYTCTTEKQALLTSQLALYQTAVTAGQEYTLRWNTTGGECTEWQYDNLVALALAIGQYVQPLVSYQQAKEVEILSCESVEDLDAIVIDYGSMA